jgi:diamine N-acetyltransferase
VVSAAARVATPKDASLLAELGARTFRRSSPNTRHEDVESYVRENFTRDKLLGCLRVKNSAALILEKNGQAIGYALLSPGKEPNQLVPPDSIQIKWLYILEEWTGRKLGDVLMSRCHEHAKALGIASIWLTTWKNNGRAIHFYDSASSDASFGVATLTAALTTVQLCIRPHCRTRLAPSAPQSTPPRPASTPDLGNAGNAACRPETGAPRPETGAPQPESLTRSREA